jgi:hypothetical protein
LVPSAAAASFPSPPFRRRSAPAVSVRDLTSEGSGEGESEGERLSNQSRYPPGGR